MVFGAKAVTFFHLYIYYKWIYIFRYFVFSDSGKVDKVTKENTSR